MSSVPTEKPSAPSRGGSIGPSLLAYNAVMIIIPTVSVLLRFWSRSLCESRGQRRFWWDDWSILAALPFCITVNALAIGLVHLGPQAGIAALKLLYGTFFVYFIGLTLAKCSALLFYSRIFGSHSRAFNYALWATHCLVLVWFVAITFATIFSCDPVEKSYNPEMPGTCVSDASVWVGTTTLSVVTDFIILLLPMPMLWGLKLKRSRKVVTCIAFLCGYSSITFSLGRLISVATSGGDINSNATWSSPESLYWVGGEIPITIMSACLPSLFFLYRRVQKHGATGLFKVHISDPRAAYTISGSGTVRNGTVRTANSLDLLDIEAHDARKMSTSSLGRGSSNSLGRRATDSEDSYVQLPAEHHELEARNSLLQIEVTHEFHVEHGPVDLGLLGGGYQPYDR